MLGSGGEGTQSRGRLESGSGKISVRCDAEVVQKVRKKSEKGKVKQVKGIEALSNSISLGLRLSVVKRRLRENVEARLVWVMKQVRILRNWSCKRELFKYFVLKVHLSKTVFIILWLISADSVETEK